MMVFAFADFLAYRFQKGLYSAQRLESMGAVLAVEENFARLSPPLTIAWFHRRVSIVSWMVMYLSSTPWSHVGFLDRNKYVIDSTPVGITKRPFADYMDGRSYIMVQPLPIPSQQLF